MKLDIQEIARLLSANSIFAGYWYRHVKSGGDYKIIGFSFNAVTDNIDVLYCPKDTPSVMFNRSWEQFTDGRFVRVFPHSEE